MEGLTEGRIVHYVAYNGRHLAAMVTGASYVMDVMEADIAGEPSKVLADLVVFTNMANVNGVKSGGVQFHFDVEHSDDLRPGTWHWFGPQKGSAHE